VLSRGEGTFSLDIGEYHDTVSGDHGPAAPGPPGDPQRLLQNLGVPQDIVVPEGHQHKGKEFVWEAYVGHEVADDGTLRLWTRWWEYHPEEDTFELASRFDLRKVHQYMRRVGLGVEEAGTVVDFLTQGKSRAGTRGLQVSTRGRISDNATCCSEGHVAVVVTITVARRDGGPPRGRGVGPNKLGTVDVFGGGRFVTAGPCGFVRGRIARSDRDSVPGTRGALLRDMQMTNAGFTGR